MKHDNFIHEELYSWKRLKKIHYAIWILLCVILDMSQVSW